MTASEDALHHVARQARKAWPQLDVDHARFVQYLAERLNAQSGAALDSLAAEDLYLACACTDGDERAIALFEEHFAADIGRALRRLEFRGLDAADVRQALREKLFTHAAGPPKLAAYNGSGSLRAWVRVTILRMRIDAQRRKDARREVGMASPEQASPALPDAARDPELAYLKAQYRQTFEEALAEACGELASRERNLLRQRLSQQLTTEQMAQLHGVHRATLKRWLASARAKLLAATHRSMAARLGANADELNSVMRLIQSNLDVSVARMLESEARAPG